MVEVVHDPDWQLRVLARPLLQKIGERFPYKEEWAAPDPRTTGIPIRDMWEVPFTEVTGWCAERWGDPAVAVIRESIHGLDRNPSWNPEGTWAALGTFVWFSRTDQAIEFKLRWHQPRR